MSDTVKVPHNRADLEYKFQQTVQNVLKESPEDLDVQDFIADLVPQLVMDVPPSAFEPLQPVNRGIIFFHGNVEEGSVDDFKHDLLRAHLNLPPDIPITLNLSSVGGSVFAGLGVISSIYGVQREGRNVNVHIQGVAMSMASVLAQVANYRTIEPSAFFMLHEVQYEMSGSAADHDEERNFTTMLQESLFRHYSARTGKPISYYQDKCHKRNWYLTAEQALEEKLVDAIIPAPIYSLDFPTKPEKPKRGPRRTT